ncbi:hypothetical protein ABH922_005122 [Rhodococcus sp. 27YEA15]|uniref:hypothetical protein n=1 Tax=Rhodococcus sp. 27YEA15 TaxID=3156259 RepID=UPI003C7E1BAE
MTVASRLFRGINATIVEVASLLGHVFTGLHIRKLAAFDSWEQAIRRINSRNLLMSCDTTNRSDVVNVFGGFREEVDTAGHAVRTWRDDSPASISRSALSRTHAGIFAEDR